MPVQPDREHARAPARHAGVEPPADRPARVVTRAATRQRRSGALMHATRTDTEPSRISAVSTARSVREHGPGGIVRRETGRTGDQAAGQRERDVAAVEAQATRRRTPAGRGTRSAAIRGSITNARTPSRRPSAATNATRPPPTATREYSWPRASSRTRVAPAGAHSRTSSPSPTGTVAATSPSGEIGQAGDRVRVEAAERDLAALDVGADVEDRQRALGRRRDGEVAGGGHARRIGAGRHGHLADPAVRPAQLHAAVLEREHARGRHLQRRDPRVDRRLTDRPAAEGVKRPGRARGEQPPVARPRAATPLTAAASSEPAGASPSGTASPPATGAETTRSASSPAPHTTRSPASTGPAPRGASARSCAPAGAGATARSSAASASRATAAARRARPRSGRAAAAARARQDSASRSFSSRRLRSARAASAPSRSTGTNRVLAPGADWATASMSAEITVAIIA